MQGIKVAPQVSSLPSYTFMAEYLFYHKFVPHDILYIKRNSWGKTLQETWNDDPSIYALLINTGVVPNLRS